MNYFKLRLQQLMVIFKIKKTLPFKMRKEIIKMIPSNTLYCYSNSCCPFYYHNKIKNGDCCLYNPKWMFWKWNGFKDLLFCLNDQCKICNIKRR